MHFTTDRFLLKCSNLECLNALGEGQFEIVSTGLDIENGMARRPLKFFVCTPCASRLKESK